MLINLEVIISGAICGIILLQTSVIAPIVFKYLDQNQTRDLLRAIFPKFFLYIIFLGTLSLIISLVNQIKIDGQIIIGTITVMLSLLCYLIIPATNEAKDKNNQKRFKLLHKVSVISTVIILVTNLSSVFIQSII
tara:strand:- start:53 stop:457 length:405 start_codon:yes stop_codon:yes gene_type:complete